MFNTALMESIELSYHLSYTHHATRHYLTQTCVFSQKPAIPDKDKYAAEEALMEAVQVSCPKYQNKPLTSLLFFAHSVVTLKLARFFVLALTFISAHPNHFSL